MYETEFLKAHVLIIRFTGVGGIQGSRGAWLEDLDEALKLGTVQHHRHDAGFEFVYIKLDRPDSVRRALALSSFQCSSSTVTIHRWVPAFNPLQPLLHIPVWITLSFLPLEFIDEADKIASFLGKVLVVDYASRDQSILRYYIERYTGDLWVAKICLSNAGVAVGEVLIDYEGDELRCHHCLQFSHGTQDCATFLWTGPAKKESAHGSGEHRTSPNPRTSHSPHWRNNPSAPQHRNPPPRSSPNTSQTSGNDWTLVECKQCRRPRPRSKYYREARGGHRTRGYNPPTRPSSSNQGPSIHPRTSMKTHNLYQVLEEASPKD
jgi:hypothetical protein